MDTDGLKLDDDVFYDATTLNSQFDGCACTNGIECHKTQETKLFGEDIEISELVNIIERDSIPVDGGEHPLTNDFFFKLMTYIQVGQDNSRSSFLNNHLYVINKKYKLVNYISKGSFGMTCKAINLENQKECVLKIVRTDKHTQLVKNEIVNLAAASNGPYICKIKEVMNCVKENLLFIVMDICGNVEIFDAIQMRLEDDLKTRYKWICQILDAIDFCHCVGILHLDIKTENFVVGCKKSAYSTNKCSDLSIIDFGLSRYVGDGAKGLDDEISITDYPEHGSFSFMTPEHVQKVINYRINKRSDAVKPEDKYTYTNFDDVWACTASMFQILYRSDVPFTRLNYEGVHDVYKPTKEMFTVEALKYKNPKLTDKELNTHSNIFIDIFVNRNIRTIKQFIERLKTDKIWNL